MSRSLGDGECKHVGVIPDPEIIKSVIAPPASGGGDGDLFVIVASDGVWEFIPSSEAVELVAKYKNATEACAALVVEAAQRWKHFEGSYRDDITAIVAHVPFLEAWGEDEGDESVSGGAEEEEEATSKVFLNFGGQGLAASSKRDEEDDEGGEGGASTSEREEFAARRLSVHNPYDEDWNEEGDAPSDADAAGGVQRA